MKLRHLLLTLGSASLTFLLLHNKEKIAKEITETRELLASLEQGTAAVKEKLAIVQDHQQPATQILKDIQYKVQTYQQSIAGNLAEIKRIKDKYEQD